MEIRQTTIDLKKQVSLSWVAAREGAKSAVLLVSGIQGQDGTYNGARGAQKSLAVDTGFAGSYGDGSELGKQPYLLPEGRVNSNWTLDDDSRGDDFVLQFNVPSGAAASSLQLARWNDAEGGWEPVVAAECLSALDYDSSYLTSLPADVDAQCSTAAGLVTVGTPHFWVRLDREGAFALIDR